MTDMKQPLKKSPAIQMPKKLQQGMVLEVTVATLDDSGFGETRHEGAKLLIAGLLPGESARVRVTFVGRRESFAKVEKILRHSPKRLASPPCARLESCDGCPLMLMKYPAQLEWKHGLVTSAINRYPELSAPPVLEVISSPKPLQYRNSAKLVVAGKHGAPVIGIYRRNSHDVLDIGDCPLHHPLINRIIAAVKVGIKKGKVPIFSQRTGNGLLRYLVVRVSESGNKAMVIFVTSQRSFNEIHHLGKYLQKEVPEVAVVAQNINSSKGNVILGEQYHFLTRDHYLMASIDEIRFAISPNSFFQVNSGSAGIIYNLVKDWASLSGKEVVVDLYCGIGGISLFLASQARSVIGIEVVEAAVQDAAYNARLNKLGNCEFISGDAGDILEELREDGKKIDVMVLNPPRKGCEDTVLKRVAVLGPERLFYVSCAPASLVRDLATLAGSGYRIAKIQPVDMFPQTPHVETVVLLAKSGAPL
jgi:23S rRNA (uracil1939-C5)-methyltransferase